MFERFINKIKKELFNKFHFKKNASVKWLGNNYGGFYVDTSLIMPGSVVFSVGVGEDVSFDEALVKLGVKKVFLFDPTPRSKIFIETLRTNNAYIFTAVGVSDKDELKKFFMPKNPEHVSGSIFTHKNTNAGDFIEVQLKKIKILLQELNLNHIDVLKIDIEGSEYDVLQNLMAEKIFPTQICVEFHNRYFKNGDKLFSTTVQSLKNNNYEIYGVSKTGEEYLFVRK